MFYRILMLVCALATFGCNDDQGACWTPGQQQTGQGGAPIVTPPNGGFGDAPGKEPQDANEDAVPCSGPNGPPKAAGYICDGFVGYCTHSSGGVITQANCLSTTGSGKTLAEAKQNAVDNCNKELQASLQMGPWNCSGADTSHLKCGKKYWFKSGPYRIGCDNTVTGEKDVCACESNIAISRPGKSCQDVKERLFDACPCSEYTNYACEYTEWACEPET